MNITANHRAIKAYYDKREELKQLHRPRSSASWASEFSSVDEIVTNTTRWLHSAHFVGAA